MFPDVQRAPPVSQFVLTAPCSVSGHWQELGSVIFTPSLQVFMYNDKIPLQAFSSLDEQSQLSHLPLHVRWFNPFITLVALGWILHYFHISLVLRCPELSLDPVLLLWPQQCWGEKGHVPWHGLNVVSNAVIAGRANSWLLFDLVSSRFFSTKLLSSRATLSMSWYMG